MDFRLFHVITISFLKLGESWQILSLSFYVYIIYVLLLWGVLSSSFLTFTVWFAIRFCCEFTLWSHLWMNSANEENGSSYVIEFLSFVIKISDRVGLQPKSSMSKSQVTQKTVWTLIGERQNRRDLRTVLMKLCCRFLTLLLSAMTSQLSSYS